MRGRLRGWRPSLDTKIDGSGHRVDAEVVATLDLPKLVAEFGGAAWTLRGISGHGAFHDRRNVAGQALPT